MKQHININQLNELTKKQEHKLIKWYDERDKSCSGHLEYTVFGRTVIPLMSVGEMLEFLREKRVMIGLEWCLNDEMMCDRLWDLTKRVLKK